MTPQEACKLLQDLDNHYGYIYCLTFPSKKKYVGQSTRPWVVRWNQHKTNNGCTLLKNALNKYPLEQISWELLEYTEDKETTDIREQYYIAKLGTLAPRGYNLTPGGTKPPISVLVKNPILTPEQKKEIEFARKYNSYLTEYRDRGFNVMSYLSAQSEHVYISVGQYMSKIHSRETYADPIKGAYIRNKLHEKQKALRSRPILCVELNETFSCIADALEKHPEWNGEKINTCCRGEHRTHSGLHFRYEDITKEELLKIEQRWAAPIAKINKSSWKPRAVYCMETQKVYPSAAQAARELGIERAHITSACSGKRKSVSGYHFTYAPQGAL